MQVDGARADSAAAGQADLGLAEAREQRPERQDAGAHGLDQLVGGLEKLDLLGVYLVRAELGREHGRAEVFEQAALRDQVLYIRDVVQGDGL